MIKFKNYNIFIIWYNIIYVNDIIFFLLLFIVGTYLYIILSIIIC